MSRMILQCMYNLRLYRGSYPRSKEYFTDLIVKICSQDKVQHKKRGLNCQWLWRTRKFGSKWFQLQFAVKRTCTPPKIKEFSSRSILYRWTVAYTRTHANQPDSSFFKTEKWKKKRFHSVDKHQIKFFLSYRSRKEK